MIPVSLPVGVVTTPTDAEKSVSWKETNFVRWSGPRMEPNAGWEKYGFSPTTTTIRAIHTWQGLDGREWTAYLTEDNLYVEYDEDLVSIAPIPAFEPYVPGVGGYGDFTYSYDDYGDARPSNDQARGFGPCFTLDNYGEDLLAMSSIDGRLLRWTPPAISDPPDAAVVVPNAPTGCRTFVVTPERIVQVFCPDGDTSSYAWCDQEDIENWTPGVSSLAGELPVEPASPVIGAIYVEAGVLFATAKTINVSEYIGLPFVYNTLNRASGASPISAASMKRVVGGAMWVSEGGFWRLSGLSVEPVPCDIWPWIIENIDWDTARYQAMSVVIETLSEFWFSFPSKGSTYNDLTAVFNFREGWWAMHRIGRSAGFSASYASFPVMADRTVAYKHESGNTYADTGFMPYAETFTMNAFDGAVMSTIKQIQPEVEGDLTNLRFSFAVKRTRNNTSVYTPQRRVQANGLVDIDETARDFRMRIDQIGPVSEPWTLGPVLVDAVRRGKMP